jgi:sugar O-acyltransferase (sialic acid O-acetyltransferase NeuD family)
MDLMSGLRRYVLLGAGSLAVEVASYIVDAASASQERSLDPTRLLITDVVAPEAGRTEEIGQVAGVVPAVHQSLETVEGLSGKAGIVCNGDPEVRERLLADAAAAGLQLVSLIHPSAIVSPTAKIGAGAIICPFVFVGPLAIIGDNALLNVHATIGHDVELGASSVVSPGAQLNGFVRVGRSAFVGAGAVLHPRVALGAYSKLSAGSVLTKAVGDGYIMHGNPAVGRQMMAVRRNEGVES